MWKKFSDELLATNRLGIGLLLGYIDQETDFKRAPASTKFHLNTEGGLVEHSLNVLRFARLINGELGLKLFEDSVTIVALLHDLCKANFYTKGEEWDKEHKDKTNEWKKKEVWKVEDQLPLGHGEKSVIMAVRYIPLTADEMAAMRWHLLTTDPGTNFFYPSGAPFKIALEKYSLVKLLAIADQLAEFYESFIVKKT